MEKENKISQQEIDELGGPLERQVTLLYELASAMDTLTVHIDSALRRSGFEFTREKKMMFNRYSQAIKQAEYWYERIGVDSVMQKAGGNNPNKFSMFLADTFEILRFLMLYIDRSLLVDNMDKIEKFFAELPSAGVFPDELIQEYAFERPDTFALGEEVELKDGRKGVVDGKGNNGNWVVRIDGVHKIINEKDMIL